LLQDAGHQTSVGALINNVLFLIANAWASHTCPIDFFRCSGQPATLGKSQFLYLANASDKHFLTRTTRITNKGRSPTAFLEVINAVLSGGSGE